METKCPCCSQAFNLNNKLPILITKCGHTVCLQCYKTKMLKSNENNNENDVYICVVDKTTKFKLKENPVRNMQMVEYLKKNDNLLIKCPQHQNQYAQFYCVQCDEIVCEICACVTHSTHNAGKTLHQVKPDNFKDYLNHVIPLLSNQKTMIETLMERMKQQLGNDISLAAEDFIMMVNDIKKLLKDFVHIQDLPKLDLNYYRLKDTEQPQEDQEEEKESKWTLIKRQPYDIKAKYLNITDLYSQYYQSYVQLVNQEIYKTKNSLLATCMKDWSSQTLRLLYQGTRDGFSANSFHQLCDSNDNDENPMIIFVLSEFGQTFGAFTSKSWSSDGQYVEDRDAFLFQLNKRSVHPLEKNFEEAIHHCKSHLVIFGSGGDLCLQDNCNQHSDDTTCSLGSSYRLPVGYVENSEEAHSYMAGDVNFKVLEIEVYQITKLNRDRDFQ
eukprot:403338686